jgi:hypothetical protein
MPSSESAIVRFYEGTGRDHRGRRLDDILALPDEALEHVHDYVQWLFPLDEPSAFNSHAPLVGAADRAAFRDDQALADNLRRSFDRMLGFYGFEWSGGAVRRGKIWPDRSALWLNPYNHNYLRLTRIMKSLALLGQEELARALREALLAEYDRAPERIGPTTRSYWQNAGDV